MAKRNIAKRLIAASVAALMSFSVVSNSGLSMVEAAAPFATLNGRSYSDFEDFVDYWKGSEYLAGDDYTVVENHTFEAIWVKQGEKGKYSDGTNPGTRKTGDNAPLVVLTIVMILSLIGIAGVILIRRKRRRA